MKIFKFDKLKEKLLSLKNSNKKVMLTGVAFVVIALLIVISIYFPKSKTNTNNAGSESSDKTQITDYAAGLENKISSMLLQMESVSKVSAFVMIESTPETKYLTETEEVTNSNGGATTTSSKSTTVVFEKNGSISTPVVVTTIFPKVTGVLIVVNNISASTKYNIVRAISVVLNIDESCINILQES